MCIRDRVPSDGAEWPGRWLRRACGVERGSAHRSTNHKCMAPDVWQRCAALGALWSNFLRAPTLLSPGG
eukprot:7959570-Alexandrium_andersonii.AAC.1